MKFDKKILLSIQKNKEGIDLAKNGNKDLAYEYFCDAIDINPEYAAPYFKLCNILM